MTTSRPWFNSLRRKLATMINLGGDRFSAESMGCALTSWQILVTDFRLVAEHPFGRPTYWRPNQSGYSQDFASAVLADYRRTPTTPEQRLRVKLQRAARAGLIP